jgi:hypothetical protein
LFTKGTYYSDVLAHYGVVAAKHREQVFEIPNLEDSCASTPNSAAKKLVDSFAKFTTEEENPQESLTVVQQAPIVFDEVPPAVQRVQVDKPSTAKMANSLNRLYNDQFRFVTSVNTPHPSSLPENTGESTAVILFPVIFVTCSQ